MNPSKTMQAVSFARAVHGLQIGDLSSKFFLPFLPDGQLHCEALDHMSGGMFTRNIVLRTLFFNEQIQKRASQFTQFINLCSGLDGRYFHLPALQNKLVVYVDHAASLEFAKQVFSKTFSILPRFVEHDLLKQSPADLTRQLFSAGFNPREPTLLLWEGATYYLKEDVVWQLIAHMANVWESLILLIDCIERDGYVSPSGKSCETASMVLNYLEKNKEPWIGFFQPEEFRRKCSDLNFNSIELSDRCNVEKRMLKEALMEEKKMFFVYASKVKDE